MDGLILSKITRIEELHFYDMDKTITTEAAQQFLGHLHTYCFGGVHLTRGGSLLNFSDIDITHLHTDTTHSHTQVQKLDDEQEDPMYGWGLESEYSSEQELDNEQESSSSDDWTVDSDGSVVSTTHKIAPHIHTHTHTL